MIQPLHQQHHESRMEGKEKTQAFKMWTLTRLDEVSILIGCLSQLCLLSFYLKIYQDVFTLRSEHPFCGFPHAWSSMLSDVGTREWGLQCISHVGTRIDTTEMQGSIMGRQTGQVSGSLCCIFFPCVLHLCAKSLKRDKAHLSQAQQCFTIQAECFWPSKATVRISWFRADISGTSSVSANIM